MRISTVLCILLSALIGCSLFDNSSDPGEVLPPATQEGKNTFGCLVNGKVWSPKGNDGTPNLSLSYDPDYDSGTLDLRSYRYLNTNGVEDIIIYVNKLKTPKTVHFSDTAHSEVVFYGVLSSCIYRSRDAGVLESGFIKIEKLELSSGIVAGRFEFTLRKLNCDTIRVTDGRFDIKL